MSRLFDLPDIFKIIESSSVDQPLAIMRIAADLENRVQETENQGNL